jgi:cysteine desulfurase
VVTHLALPVRGEEAMSGTVYADHNATSPCLPAVAAAVAAALAAGLGNPSSRHHEPGRRALAALDHARAQVAALLGARDDEVVFTAGATEACNLALLGAAHRLRTDRPLCCTWEAEHPAVLEPLRAAARAGSLLTELPVDGDGRYAPLPAVARPGLVAALLVNNETGVVQDLPAIAAAAHAAGALVFCDATQAPGRLPLEVAALGCDLLAISGHKFGGPPGCGALWLRRGLGLEPLLHGGGQERGLRPGTPPVALLAGLGLAAELARRDLDARRDHLGRLTARLESGLRAAIPGLVVQGAGAPRAPGTSCVTVPGLPRGWLGTLVRVAASSGSSCASGSGKPSHVLAAMGVPAADAANSIRLSFAPGTTVAEVDTCIAELARGAAGLRC